MISSTLGFFLNPSNIINTLYYNIIKNNVLRESKMMGLTGQSSKVIFLGEFWANSFWGQISLGSGWTSLGPSKASLSKDSCHRGFKCLPHSTEVGRPCDGACKSRGQKALSSLAL